jgi:DNA-binding HxlR family transcriptional regulator
MHSDGQEKGAKVKRPVAVRKTLEIFSDPWAFSVLQEIFFGVRRFDDIQENLAISRSVLTRRLKHLLKKEIIERTRYSTHRYRYEYRLTARGIDMYPIFLLLRDWGERWLKSAETPTLTLLHTPCGQVIDVRVVCGHCHGAISAKTVKYAVDEKSDIKSVVAAR